MAVYGPNKVSLGIGEGFKFGLGFALGWFVASFIVLPIFACIGFLVLTLLGGSLGALMNNF